MVMHAKCSLYQLASSCHHSTMSVSVRTYGQHCCINLYINYKVSQGSSCGGARLWVLTNSKMNRFSTEQQNIRSISFQLHAVTTTASHNVRYACVMLCQIWICIPIKSRYIEMAIVNYQHFTGIS
jgi:hypothetical protein